MGDCVSKAPRAWGWLRAVFEFFLLPEPFVVTSGVSTALGHKEEKSTEERFTFNSDRFLSLLSPTTKYSNGNKIHLSVSGQKVEGVNASLRACDAGILHFCIWLSINPSSSTFHLIVLLQNKHYREYTKVWFFSSVYAIERKRKRSTYTQEQKNLLPHLSYGEILGFQGSNRVPPLRILPVISRSVTSTFNGSTSSTNDCSGLNNIVNAFWYLRNDDTELVGSVNSQSSRKISVDMSPAAPELIYTSSRKNAI